MNALIEMTALCTSRPSATAPVEQVAAWYQAKARMHEALAARRAPAEQARELRYAASAAEHARQLIIRD